MTTKAELIALNTSLVNTINAAMIRYENSIDSNVFIQVMQIQPDESTGSMRAACGARITENGTNTDLYTTNFNTQEQTI